MKLWTWQGPGFSLTEGYVDIRQSEYANNEPIIAVYKDLASRIGTDQIIWCLTKRDAPFLDRVEWVLDVPCDEIVKFVDNIVWNRMLGKRPRPPKRIRDEITNEAFSKFPQDSDARRRLEQELEDQFWSQPPPEGTSWWDHLFVAPAASEDVCALVRHPLKPEWVVSNPLEQRGG